MPLTLTPDVSVGQLVAERPGRAKIFEKYRIDYCCGGKLSVAAICEKKGIDPEALLAEIARAELVGDPTPEETWLKRPIPELVAHILETHHAFLKEAMPRLEFLTTKVARVHGDDHPELHEVASVFAKFKADMEQHMGKEENVLFPLMLKIAAGQASASEGSFVAHPIRAMESEHDGAGRDLEKIRELTGDFVPPEGACNSYRAMLDGLLEIEADTFVHVHKENNVLFPRVLGSL